MLRGQNSVCPRNRIFFVKPGMPHEENSRCNMSSLYVPATCPLVYAGFNRSSKARINKHLRTPMTRETKWSCILLPMAVLHYAVFRSTCFETAHSVNLQLHKRGPLH